MQRIKKLTAKHKRFKANHGTDWMNTPVAKALVRAKPGAKFRETYDSPYQRKRAQSAIRCYLYNAHNITVLTQGFGNIAEFHKLKPPHYAKKDIGENGNPKVGHSYDGPPYGPLRIHPLQNFGEEAVPCEDESKCNGHAEYAVYWFHSQDYCCGFKHVKEAKLCAVHVRLLF